MAGGLIGALRVTLGIDTAAFETGSKRAADTAKRNATQIEKSYSSAADGVKTSMGTLAAALSIGAIVAASKRALDYASALGETSQQLGVTVRDLQVYRYAATQAGQSQEEMDRSLGKLTLNLGEAANGSKAQAGAFRELGIAVTDANGRIYTAGEVLPRIAEALSKIKDPAARARLEFELLGKMGQKLDPLLTGGAKGIKAYADEAEKAGLILSDELATGADNAADKLSKLQQQLETRLARLVSAHAEEFAHLAEQLLAAADAALKFAAAYPTAIGVLGGAAVGARVAGAPGAMVGALGGIVGAAYSNLHPTDPSNLSNAELTKQMREATQGMRAYKAGAAAGDSAAIAEYRDREKRAKALNDEAAKRIAGGRSKKPGPVVGDGALPTIKSGATHAAKAAHAPRDNSEAEEERFARELANINDDILQIKAEFVTDLRTQAQLQHERVAKDQAQFESDVDSRVAQKKLTDLQGQALKDAEAKKVEQQNRAINWRLDDDLTREELRVRDDSLNLQADLKRGELAEAETQAERRKLQLELLDIEYQRQRAALEAVKALHTTTDAEYQTAQARLDQLDTLKSHDVAQTLDATAGPMEAFGKQLHRTAGQISEDFQQIEVDGIKSLNDGLIDAILNSRNLGDVFSSVAKQILADLIKIGLQAAESSFFGKGSGGGGGGGIGGLLSGLLGVFGGKSVAAKNAASFSLPGFADGGAIRVRGNHGIDTNLMSINGEPAARVNRGENIEIVPEKSGRNSSPTTIINADFRGADADAVPRIEAALKRLDGSVEIRAVRAVGDATDRRVLRRG